MPFVVTGTEVDRPHLVTVRIAKRDDGSYVVEAALQPPRTPGLLERTIELTLDLVEAGTLSSIYHGNVIPEE